MQLPKLNVLLPSTVALCVILLSALPALGEPTGDPRVREAQTLLTERNYKPGPVDGLLGPRTLSAILRFQIDSGLPPTRELDEVTLEALRGAKASSQGEASSEKPAARSVQTTPSETPTESRDTQTDVGRDGTEEITTVPKPNGSETMPARAEAARENRSQMGAATPLPETEVPPAPSLAEDNNLAAVDEDMQAKENVPEPATQDAKSQHESPFSFLPLEFTIENALFVGLLAFAAVAVMAAIYTSIRGREPKDAEQPSNADAETILTRVPEEGLEATVIAPVEPMVTAPPEAATTSPPAEANGDSPTEFMRPFTDAATSAEAVQSAPTELWSEAEPGPESQESELSEPLRDPPPQEDPLADLNVYLAFERFDQAEALVKDAIERYPQRHEYLLRLLEVYTAARNPLAFEFHARALRDAVGEKSPLMGAALRWWDTISPERPLFEEPLEEEGRRLSP